LEVSFIGYIETIDDSSILVYLGPGMGWGDDSSDSSWLFHAGAGYHWQLSDHFYVRPDTRLTWEEFQVDHHIWELSFAVGRTF
jgi:outer membrane autotransporter protein